MVNRGKDKDADREINDRKRRKSSSASNEVMSNKLKEDIYTSVVKFEEQESRHRPAEKDSEIFHNACAKLRLLFSQIVQLKQDNSEKSKQEINEKRIEVSFLFVLLKKLNRLDKVRLRSGRDALHTEKLSVDSNRLQLQNLLYEAEHLRKEVQRCLQFKSQDEEIDLVSEVDFYEQAPHSISRPDKTKKDEHSRKLARLEWELHQRKELARLCTELQSTKEKIATEIESKTDRLNSLAPRLDALLKATRPLQEVLDMEIEKKWEIQKNSRLLPTPLYLVYMNLTAYAEASNQLFVTTIQGDEEEAKQLESIEKNSKTDLNEISQDSDDENNDENNDENDQTTNTHHHRRQSKFTLVETKKNNLLFPHPLNVSFKFQAKVNNSEATLTITLFYLPILNFVTVGCTINGIENSGVVAGEVIAPITILDNLMPNDVGEESPNPKTIYQLQELSIDPNNFLMLLHEKGLGKPFKWAQQLCGLDFIHSVDTVHDLSYDLSQSTIADIIKKIRCRWQSRITLHKQILALENKESDSLISKDNDSNPIRVLSCLVQWCSLSWLEFSSVPPTKLLIEENIATPHDLFYRAVITRGSAKLECFVCIYANFPLTIPHWCLQLNWNGTYNAHNNSTIREMESWINNIGKIKNMDYILGTQINRALYCLDIYLETEESTSSNVEFQPDKTFLKAFRCRNRARPFKIIRNTCSIVYTQL